MQQFPSLFLILFIPCKSKHKTISSLNLFAIFRKEVKQSQTQSFHAAAQKPSDIIKAIIKSRLSTVFNN